MRRGPKADQAEAPYRSFALVNQALG
jgi:hypothetical protein